jgi:hypothetical protein
MREFLNLLGMLFGILAVLTFWGVADAYATWLHLVFFGGVLVFIWLDYKKITR